MAQQQLKFVVSDGQKATPLAGVLVNEVNSDLGGITDMEGIVLLEKIAPGDYQFHFSLMGYELYELKLKVTGDSIIDVSLFQEVGEFGEVVVEATRSNRTIADLPTRTEALTEEIDEAASMEPSKIAHLITHSTGIQVQTTAASSNGAVVRIQGLQGRYTQMLRDGFPLYGGFSGSLDILQIPPLDLRQVEYIKGPASTLYGGGAIAGIVNLISKRADQNETLLHLNYSHIGARDFNVFASRRFGQFGFTNLASFHLHNAYDPDKDGFSDISQVAKINFNPKLYYYPSERTEIYLGGMIARDDRVGGAMGLLESTSDTSDFYFDQQLSTRYTSQLAVTHEVNQSSTLIVKNSVSWFDRDMAVQSAPTLLQRFKGVQLSSFSEATYAKTWSNAMLTGGLNFYTDQFEETELDQLPRNQSYKTTGIFANHIWDITRQLALESGMRLDAVTASGNGSEQQKQFVLPRVSGLLKANSSLSFRLGGGMGYRMPTIFSEDAEPLVYTDVLGINFDSINPERSIGGNFDIKFRSTFGLDNFLLTLNQLFYANVISDPILLQPENGGLWRYQNSTGQMTSQGFESQLKMSVGYFTWFVGYTLTIAQLEEGGVASEVILTPKHSVKGDLLFVIEDKWRIGWDYDYKSGQWLSDGSLTRSLFTTGIVIERTLNEFVLFFNAENMTDVRQSRYGSTVSGPYGTPQYTEIWAPQDGLFVNLGFKLKL